MTPNRELPGVNPRWIDKEKGFPKRHACFPLEIVQAVSKARDIGIPAKDVHEALERLIQAQQA